MNRHFKGPISVIHGDSKTIAVFNSNSRRIIFHIYRKPIIYFLKNVVFQITRVAVGPNIGYRAFSKLMKSNSGFAGILPFKLYFPKSSKIVEPVAGSQILGVKLL
jgi:hypothetical protein